jgi:hypothetical protein
MSFQTEHQEKFRSLSLALAPENREQIRLAANGGNTVLFVFPPEDEEDYIAEAKRRYANVRIIDVRELFVRYIERYDWDEFVTFYNNYRMQPEIVFRTDGENKKLFHMIIDEIENSITSGFIPFLVHTGALYGTGIENINIMQDSKILQFGLPLVFFYPAVIRDDQDLRFLGFKPASKYRCKLIK